MGCVHWERTNRMVFYFKVWLGRVWYCEPLTKEIINFLYICVAAWRSCSELCMANVKSCIVTELH